MPSVHRSYSIFTEPQGNSSLYNQGFFKKALKLSSFEQEFRYLGRIFGFYQGNPFRCVHMFNKI